MTGLECLKEEMTRRGCTKSQVESKTVAVVLEIVANGGSIYTDLTEAKKELEEYREETWQHKTFIHETKKELNEVRKELLAERAKLSKRQEDAFEYLKEFEHRVMECETPEQRDILRTAQFYVNNTKIMSPQNNTARIIGLALILAGHKIDPEKLEPYSLIDPSSEVKQSFFDLYKREK